jgi:hypothetical protein
MVLKYAFVTPSHTKEALLTMCVFKTHVKKDKLDDRSSFVFHSGTESIETIMESPIGEATFVVLGDMCYDESVIEALLCKGKHILLIDHMVDLEMCERLKRNQPLRFRYCVDHYRRGHLLAMDHLVVTIDDLINTVDY